MTTTDTGGRYAEAAMTEAMRRIADQLDVPSHDARLLRLTNNAVFALPTAAIVVRITRSTTLHHRVHKVARLATWFAERNAPTTRLATQVDQLSWCLSYAAEAVDGVGVIHRYVPCRYSSGALAGCNGP